jgi:hypothetical protein
MNSSAAGGAAKRAIILGLIYVIGFLYQIFLFGWVVPLGLGTYRLVRGRR